MKAAFLVTIAVLTSTPPEPQPATQPTADLLGIPADIVVLRSGGRWKVRADPPRPRPPDAQRLRFQFLDGKGFVELRSEQIAHIEYFEQIAIQQVENLLGAGELERARTLANRVYYRAPSWQADQDRTVDFKHLARLIAEIDWREGQSLLAAGKEEEAITVLLAVHQLDPAFPGLQAVFERIYRARADRASPDHHDRAFLQAVETLAGLYPGSTVVFDLRERLRKTAESRAEESARQLAIRRELLITESATPGTDWVRIRAPFLPSMAALRGLPAMPLDRWAGYLTCVTALTECAEVPPGYMRMLADRIEVSRDNAGLRVDLVLRKDAVWADGGPITARDLKFTLDQCCNPASPRFNRGLQLSGFTALMEPGRGPWELTLHWDRPVLDWRAPLTVPIWNQAAANPADAAGAGPFMVSESAPGEWLMLVRNPVFYEPNSPKIQGVKWILSDDHPALDALQASDIVIQSPGGNALDDFHVHRLSDQVLTLLAFNCRDKLRSSAVRRAIRQAVDVEAAVRAAFGRLHAGITPVPPGSPWPPASWARPPAAMITSEPQVVRDFLRHKTDDQPELRQLKLLTPRGLGAQQLAQAIAMQLQSAGLTVVLEAVDDHADLFQRQFCNADFDLALWQVLTHDAERHILETLDPAATGPGRPNFLGPDLESQELIHTWRELSMAQSNPSATRDLYRQASEVLQRQCYFVGLCTQDVSILVRTGLSGVTIGGPALLGNAAHWQWSQPRP